MNKNKAKTIVNALAEVFTDKPALNFDTPYQLLVAVILSAQCTDERVNKVTAKLFERYGTPQDMLTLSEQGLQEYIFSCGLYKNKAKNILLTTKAIVEKHGGQVPNDLESLQTLPGVGRKTANVVYSVAFKGDAIAVDTHVFRVARRIGFSTAKTVLGVEKDLMKSLERKDWSRSHHYLIYLGRSYCKAKNPNCKDCPITHTCNKKI